jgi:hypothetical protein
MAFPPPRYKKGLRPIRSSPVDREILREHDFTSAGMAPIPVGKNNFSFPDEFAALKKRKLEHGTNGQLAKD